MAEIDPVILQLRADVTQYQATLKGTTSLVDAQLGRQANAVKRLEAQMQRSSGAIASSFRGMAAGIAGALSVQQIQQSVDGWTRYTNQLKVAGLEGQALTSVQEQLFASAQRGGVQVELLGSLYQRLSSLQKDLNLSSADTIALSDGVANAIKISGVSAGQASGAILGLRQALGQSRVQAAEFNQIQEGLPSLLLAGVNASDKYKGSVNALTQAIKDQSGPGVSNIELLQLIQSGLANLATGAQKANLTIAQSFTVLDNALGKYIQTSEAGATATGAVSAAITGLANNLDTIIPALAVISTALGTRFVTSALAGGTALRTLGIQAAVATNSMAGAALVARGAGAALLGAFGGPVGLAVTALATGLAYLATRQDDATASIQRYQAAQSTATQGRQKAISLSEQYAAAIGKERAEIEKTIRAELALAKVRQATAKSDLAAEIAKTKEAGGNYERLRQKILKGPNRKRGSGEGVATASRSQKLTGLRDAALARAGALRAATENLNLANGVVAELQNAPRGQGPIKTGGASSVSAPAPSKGGEASKGRSGPSGPSAAELAEQARQTDAQFQSELEGLRATRLQAEAALIGSAESEYKARIAQIDADEKSYGRQVDLDSKLGAARQEQLKAAKAAVATEERAKAFKEREVAQLEQENRLASIDNEAEAEIARLALDMATTRDQRAACEKRLLEIAQTEERNAINLALATKNPASDEYQRALARKKRLDEISLLNNIKIKRDNEGPLARYKRDQRDKAANIGDEFERIQVSALESFNDGLVDAIVNSKNLGDVFKNVGKQILADLVRIAAQQLIVNQLFGGLGGGAGGVEGGGGVGGGGGGILGGLFGGGGGGGGGIFGRLLGGLFGRASGGPVQAGQMYRVNETQQEYFQPLVPGRVIPQSSMQLASPAAQSGMAVVRLELSGDIDARIASVSGPVAVEVVRSAAPQIANAGADLAISKSQRRSL